MKNRKSPFGFYVVSTITGQKCYRKYVESHKISCVEEIVSYSLLTGPYQVCSNNLKQSSLNLYSSVLRIHSATNLFCYCAERIYNKIQKCQVSAFVEIMLFTMFEFNWQKRIECLRRRHYDTLLATHCSMICA